MSTTPDRGHSLKVDSDTRPRTTFIRSTTSTRRAAPTRSAPPSRSTSTSSTSSSTPTSTSSDEPAFRIAVATSTPSALATATPTPISTGPDTTDNMCYRDSDCAEGVICSGGTCTGGTNPDLFDSMGPGSTTHLGTGSAVGIVAGVLGLAVVLFVLGFWCMRSKRRRQPIKSEEAPQPQTNRSMSSRNQRGLGRSASAATGWTTDNDQKTLVGSLPNSPQDARFASHRGMLPEYYSPGGKLDEIVEKDESASGVFRNNTSATRDSTNKALPAPPAEEMTYALNVSINKSMIFEDSLFSASTPQTPRSRAPRYRFEEVVPPVPGQTPRISITKPKSTARASRASEYELYNYPSSRQSDLLSEIETRSRGSTQYGQAQVHNLRGHAHALKRLEGRLPPLPSQAHIPPQPSSYDTVPPSPSFSFASYDWYREIIDPPGAPCRTPTLGSRANATGVNPLLSHPFTADPALIPAPLSSAQTPRLSFLHPSSALTLDSPTSPDFRLPSTVYQMPARLPKFGMTPPETRPSSVSTDASLRSGPSRLPSWMPNDDSMDVEDDGDLPLPRFPRHQSMAASLAMATEPGYTPKQTPAHTRRGSRATARNSAQNSARNSARQSRSWVPSVAWSFPADDSEDSFAIFKREYLDKRPDSYSPLT